MGKKKKKAFKVIDASSFTDKKAKALLDEIQEDIKDTKIKGIISIVVPAKGSPLLYTNIKPEEAFLHTYRATGLIAGMISINEEAESYEDGNEDE